MLQYRHCRVGEIFHKCLCHWTVSRFWICILFGHRHEIPYCQLESASSSSSSLSVPHYDRLFGMNQLPMHRNAFAPLLLFFCTSSASRAPLSLLTPGSMLKINWFIVVIHWTCQNTPINDNQHSLEGTTKELHFAHWRATYHRLLIDTYLLPNLGQEVHSLLLEQPLDWLSPWWCRSARCQVHSGPISHCFTRISGVCVLGLHFSFSSSASEPLTITLELFHLDNNISSSIFNFFFFTYLHLIHCTVSNFSK